MKRLMVFAVLATVCAGCVCVGVRPEHCEKIEKYGADGSLAKAKDEIGHTANPTTTFFWALIPGANKIHIARKIEQSPYCEQFKRDYPVVTAKLLADGWVCAAFSWIPYLYEFTMPCQAGSGVFPDVVRVNNLMWMYHVDSKQ